MASYVEAISTANKVVTPVIAAAREFGTFATNARRTLRFATDHIPARRKRKSRSLTKTSTYTPSKYSYSTPRNKFMARRRISRRPYRRRRRTRRTRAVSSKRMVGIVRRELRKTVDVHRLNTTTTWTETTGGTNLRLIPGELGVWHIGNTITRGTEHKNRIGNEIKMLGMNTRIFCENRSQFKMGVRIMLVQHKRPLQNPDVDIWEDNDNDATGNNDNMDDGNTGTEYINSFNQLYRKVNKMKFNLLANTVFYCERNTAEGTKTCNRMFRKFYKMSRKMTYDEDSTDSSTLYPTIKLLVFYNYMTSDVVSSTDQFNRPKITMETAEYFLP